VVDLIFQENHLNPYDSGGPPQWLEFQWVLHIRPTVTELPAPFLAKQSRTRKPRQSMWIDTVHFIVLDNTIRVVDRLAARDVIVFFPFDLASLLLLLDIIHGDIGVVHFRHF
jgi:hypothetical protein